MEKNFISVVIPAYNEEDVIAKAINSVLKSSYKNYEIIVVNNGSTDRTQQIAESIARKHPKKIQLLNFPPVSDKEIAKKRGPAFSRNRGAEVAKGDILFFLDADDWVKDDTLENIITAFKRYKEIDFIVGNREVKIPNNWRKILLSYWIWRKKFSMKPERISYTEPFCPYIIKTKEFFRIGKFNEKAYYYEDEEFRLRLEKLKIPKLISKSINYYTDMGSHFSDFKRQASNMAKSFMIYPFRAIGVFIQLLLSFFSFPIFYLIAFSIFIWRTGDIFVSVTSPFIWILRRILEFYYLIKLTLK
jgi:glycosyltransferase involved in cell wall biosynthesis